MYAIGIDIGGSHFSSAAVDLDGGRLVTSVTVTASDSSADADAILAALEANISETLRKSGDLPLIGIGMAFPGPFDYRHGISEILGVGKFEKIFGMDIAQTLRSKLKNACPDKFLFVNDAAAFAMGEAAYGAARGSERAIAVTLGTGIGSGFISGGHIVDKGDGVPADGWLYPMPFKGKTAEEWFSSRRLCGRYRELSGTEVSGVREIAGKCPADAAAVQVFAEFGRNLGEFLLPVAKEFRAGTIVLGGNISKAFHLFRDEMENSMAEAEGKIAIKVSESTENAAISGSAALLADSWKARETGCLRKTAQYLLPEEKQEASGYDIYPVHAIGQRKIFSGYGTLADRLADMIRSREKEDGAMGRTIIVIDGYVGIRFGIFAEKLSAEFRARGIDARWWNAAAAMKSPEQIDRITAPWLGGDDPLFGFRTGLSLEDFFDRDRLSALRAALGSTHGAGTADIVYGTGAYLAAGQIPGTSAILVYVDIPKNEIQFRSRAGAIANLGAAGPEAPKKMYKRFYFVDWVVLNREKKRLLPITDIVADGQREDCVSWASGKDIRAGLEYLAHNGFRPRPWFEPGAWGGQWIKEHIKGLAGDVPNYAWSFELIVPENGILFESGGKMLEISFDSIMYENGKAVVGKECLAAYGDEFPIRMDYLDNFGGGNLSIQCHPQKEYIRKHFGEVLTQEETYYILDTTGDAVVYLGFKEDIVPEEFEAALNRSFKEGTPLDVDRYVNSEHARRHDLFLIPPGTLHSSGRNNLVLEISTTPYIFTFKMYDWLALDLDGKPRPLNIRRAMENLCFDRKGEKIKREHISASALLDSGDGWELWHLPTHPRHSYDVHRYRIETCVTVRTEDKCHVLNLVEGETAEVTTAGGMTFRLHYAETLVISAAAGSYTITNTSAGPIMVVKAFMK